MNTMENNKEKPKYNYGNGMIKVWLGPWNVRIGEGKRGYKCDISEAQQYIGMKWGPRKT